MDNYSDEGPYWKAKIETLEAELTQYQNTIKTDNTKVILNLQAENKALRDVDKIWMKCSKFLEANLFDGENRWFADKDELRFLPSDLRELLIEMLESVLQPPTEPKEEE